jgi:hypothetical protein
MLYLVYREHYIVLRTPSGIVVGILDKRTTEALRGLSDLKSVRFEAFPAVDELANRTQLLKKKGKIVGITVKINVYGGRNDISAVGKRLSECAIYLQHPDNLDENIEYDNPHYLTLRGQLRPKQSPFAVPRRPGEPTKDTATSDITTLFHSLKRYKCLQQVDVDSRIKTPLLR